MAEDKYEDKEKPVSIGANKLVVGNSHRNANLYAKFGEPWYTYRHTSESGTRNSEDTTVRNISPQLGEAEEWNTPEQSNSEDSSLSDSDKTLVGDAPEGADLQPQSWHSRNYKISKQFEIENWGDIDDDSDYYFKATPYIDSRQQKCTLKCTFLLLLRWMRMNDSLFVLFFLFCLQYSKY